MGQNSDLLEWRKHKINGNFTLSLTGGAHPSGSPSTSVRRRPVARRRTAAYAAPRIDGPTPRPQPRPHLDAPRPSPLHSPLALCSLSLRSHSQRAAAIRGSEPSLSRTSCHSRATPPPRRPSSPAPPPPRSGLGHRDPAAAPHYPAEAPRSCLAVDASIRASSAESR